MPPNNPNQYFQPTAPAPQGAPPQVPITAASLAPKKPVGLIVGLAVSVLLLLGAIGFSAWAFSERSDYKNNSDQKVAAAVAEAEKATTEKNNQRFAEELKSPLKTYTGPASYGTVTVKYPKTWSAYVTTGGGSNEPLNAYFHPDIVPAVTQTGSSTREAIALKIQVTNQPYDQVIKQYESQVTSGNITAAAFALPKMPDQVGMKFVGKLDQQLNGTEIVLPLRDKTLIITTETDNYLADFNNHILQNLTFVP